MSIEPTEQGPPSSRKGGLTHAAKPAIDIGELIRSGEFRGEFKPRESAPERKSRLGIEAAKAKHLLWKERAIPIVTLLGVSAIAAICVAIALRPEPSEDKKWAMSILAAIVSGGVGYLARGNATKSD
jgi:hypothetical protein